MIRGDDDDVRDIHSRDKPLVTRIHATLRTVLHIVPSASALLVPILAELFPHKRESVSVHDRYVRNLIRVVEYAPAIRDPVLEFMMEHALQIDVEITLDMDDMDEEDERLMVELDGKRDPTDDTDGDESDHASELGEDFQGDDSDGDMADTGEDRVETLRRMKEMMAKLDRVLTTIFDFYQDHLRLGKRCLEQQRAGDDGDDGESFADDEERTAARACTTSDPAPSDLLSLFMTTITTFDRCVLRTHKAKYTQSLLFYLCSLHHTLPDTLLGVLITRVFDPTLATYLRCTSAAYLASYLARAKYVPPETIAQCLRLCTDWVHSTLDRIERRARGPNPHKHPVFYAVVQAVRQACCNFCQCLLITLLLALTSQILYIFCFRWRELVVANEADNTGNIQGDTTILLASAKQAHGTDFTAAPLTSSSPDVNWYDAHQSGIISASHIAQRRTSISSTTSPSQQQPQPLGVTGPNMDWWRLRGGFERIIYSRLNPLKVCARNVVREFDAISQRLQLVYCSSLIYANKAAAAFAAAGAGDEEEMWSKLPPSALAARRAAVETQSTNGKSATVTTESGTQQTGKTVDVQLEDIIESFFPFDPYYTHLSYSSAIEKLYVPWRGCVEDDEEAEDDEENVDDQEEADDEDKDAAADEQDETDDGNATEDAE